MDITNLVEQVMLPSANWLLEFSISRNFISNEN